MSRDKHQKHLDTLRKMARDVIPVGAARMAASLVYKNDIVAFGINSLKTHPIQAKYGQNPLSIHLHAEIDCIKNATRVIKPEDFEKTTLYVARMKFTEPHKLSMVQGIACPCVGCQKAIMSFGIPRVIYTLDDIGYGEL